MLIRKSPSATTAIVLTTARLWERSLAALIAVSKPRSITRLKNDSNCPILERNTSNGLRATKNPTRTGVSLSPGRSLAQKKYATTPKAVPASAITTWTIRVEGWMSRGMRSIRAGPGGA